MTKATRWAWIVSLVAVTGAHALFLQYRDDAANYDAALSVW